MQVQTKAGLFFHCWMAGIQALTAVSMVAVLMTADSGLGLFAAPLSQEKIAVVGVNGATLLSMPGAQVAVLLAPAAIVTATGRTSDSQWVYVTTEEDQLGWVAAGDLLLFGVTALPVLAVDIPPEIEPTVSNDEHLATDQTANDAASDGGATAPSTQNEELEAPEVDSTMVHDAQRILVEVATTDSRLNIRSGPGAQYAIVGKAESGEMLTALARNDEGNWIQISRLEGDTATGWVAANFVRSAVALQELSINQTIPEPTPIEPVAPANPSREPDNVLSGQTESTQAAVTQPTPAVIVDGLQGKIVFSTGRGGAIYLYFLETGELRFVTNGNDPALSPDGAQVTFTRAGGEYGLYLIDSSGGDERKIFSERELVSSPKWSPDGAWIVFTSSNDKWECYILGGACFTHTELAQQNPAFADPEVAARFLEDVATREDRGWTLGRVDVNGNAYRDIGAMPQAQTPDWGAGGIVYQSVAGLQVTADLPDATSRAAVAEHYVHDPDWQPRTNEGGGRIIYQQRRGSHWEIFAANPEGGEKTALTRPATVLVDQLPSNVAPAWSFNGQQIVFLSNRTDKNEAGAWRIWIMDADGGNQRPSPLMWPSIIPIPVNRWWIGVLKSRQRFRKQ